jgi:hypothetical protein
MYVKKISEVKEHLNELKGNGLIEEWELPYENLLTRLTAAIFFLTPAAEYSDRPAAIWSELEKYDYFSCRINKEKKLSSLLYRVTFNEEEMEKNLKTVAGLQNEDAK